MLSAWFDWYSIDAWLIKIGKFSVSKFLTNFFFYASFVFRIHMHCIVFCIHLVVLKSYLSLFSHITCIHFAKLGTQLDLKINWLIFESLLHFSICYFMCELQKIFFLKDMIDNQCANIFSTYVIVYKSHSVKFAYIERENIFLQLNPHFF